MKVVDVNRTCKVTKVTTQICTLSFIPLKMTNSSSQIVKFPFERSFSYYTFEVSHSSELFKQHAIQLFLKLFVMQGGGILNFTALVICGNGDGVAGYGKGKSADVSAAVDKVGSFHLFNAFEPVYLSTFSYYTF